jgi:hypothetical protein
LDKGQKIENIYTALNHITEKHFTILANLKNTTPSDKSTTA